MALAPERTRTRTIWSAIAEMVVLFVALYAATNVGLERWFPPAWIPWVEVCAAVVFVPLFAWSVFKFVRGTARRRRASRAVRDARREGRWPLGAPYDVQVDARDNGERIWHSLTLGEGDATFQPKDGLGRKFDFARIDVIHVRPTWIEFVSGAESVRVVPKSYADRERLLWELAVRFNDAMERGIPTADPDAIVSGGSGLASALAGPMDRGNPAPPRNSGLGNGLFVAPPSEE